MNELKLSDFTDLTVEELALIDKSIHWNRQKNLINFGIEMKIMKYVNMYSGQDLIDLASKALKIFKKTNHDYTNKSILWLIIMNNEETRNIFNTSINKVLCDVKRLKDMSDLYILLLAEYFVNNKEVDNIELLKNKYFKNLKKNNMRKNYKTVLDTNMGEEA